MAPRAFVSLPAQLCGLVARALDANPILRLFLGVIKDSAVVSLCSCGGDLAGKVMGPVLGKSLGQRNVDLLPGR